MAAKILIIEDEPGLVTTLRDRLRKHGYEVSAAGDGASAAVTVDRYLMDGSWREG